jgi:hypothetical protein
MSSLSVVTVVSALRDNYFVQALSGQAIDKHAVQEDVVFVTAVSDAILASILAVEWDS